MTAEQTEALLHRYYDAFNRGDTQAMLDCLAQDVVHDVSQGGRREGKERFGAFLDHMNRCYRETLSNIVIMTDETGTHAAAEFDLSGEYLETDEGLPEANGQAYTLRVGAFFEIRDGRITRVSTHYNLADWTRQVSV